jgi:hypothetical protein
MYEIPGGLAIHRRDLLRTLAIAACSASQLNSARGAPATEDRPATHNWMLVGSQTAFLSHLPMFERLNPARTEYLTPHRYQVILQASFNGRGSDVSSLYFADRQGHPDIKMYSVSPAAQFVLARVAAPSPLTSFKATVLQGHLERGGEPIRGLQDVDVKIQKVVHFHKFDPAAQAPPSLEYLLFGRGPEFFLAHSIVKPPDFDQIVSVEVSGLKLTDADLGTAIRLSIPSKKNSSADRMKEGEQAAAELSDGRKLNVRIIREFYFEEGELLIPATFDTTPEEKKAGFSG